MNDKMSNGLGQHDLSDSIFGYETGNKVKDQAFKDFERLLNRVDLIHL